MTEEEAICVFCWSRRASDEVGGVPYCKFCADTNPYLIEGIRVHTKPSYKFRRGILESNPALRSQNEQFVLPLKWYNLVGLHDTFQLIDYSSSEKVEDLHDEIKNIVHEMGTKQALTFLTVVRYISEIVVQDEFTEKEVGIPPRMWEYAIALVGSIGDPEEYSNTTNHLKTMYDFSLSGYEGGYHNKQLRVYDPESKQLIQCLEKLFSVYNSEYRGLEGDLLDEENILSSAAQDSELIYGEYAYTEQYLESLERIFGPYQSDFLKHYNIDMIKSTKWSSHLSNLHFQRIGEVIQEIRYYEIDSLRLLGGLAKAVEKGNQIHDFLQSDIYKTLQRGELESWALLLSTAERRLWVSHKELVSLLAPFNENRVTKFIERISVPIGQFDHKVGTPFGFNQLEETPLLKFEDKYLIANPVMFSRSLAKTFFYDLLQVHNDCNKNLEIKFNKRGKFLEEWVYDLACHIFSEEEDSAVYKGIEPDNSDEELDIVVIHNSTVFIFEVKSKFLTDEARKGNVDQIKNDLDEGILKAVDQISTKIGKLERNEISIKDSSQDVDIKKDINNFLPIVIMGGEYDQLATQEYVKQIPDRMLVPYVASVYDLDIISRIIPEYVPAEVFKDYIPKRIRAVKYGQIKSMDEIDFFGAGLNGTLDIYDDPLSGEMYKEMADFPTFHLHANIYDAGNVIRDLIPEYEWKYFTRWLTESEIEG